MDITRTGTTIRTAIRTTDRIRTMATIGHIIGTAGTAITVTTDITTTTIGNKLTAVGFERSRSSWLENSLEPASFFSGAALHPRAK
jgi:hypothetical protein